MPHDEPWQIFAQNGEAKEGNSAKRNDFSEDLIMGASHLWLWRKGATEQVEILLQKRASSKTTWPGHYDISAAGHIDAGESPVQCIVREAREEIGLEASSEDLYYIFSLRTPLSVNEIDHVYHYESPRGFNPRFDDGEVESTQWLTISELRTWAANPNEYHLVNQGEGYFSLLLSCLEKL